MISSASMADFFKVMKNELGVLVDTTNFIFALYEEKNDMLTAPFMEDEKDEIAPTWSAARSLTGYVVKQGKTVLLNKAEISKLAAESIIDIIGTPAECWLGVPLISSKKVLGVIVIQSYSDQNAFTQLGIEILETVAKQFTVYIEKKQIEEESLILSKAVVQSPVTIVITDLNGSIEYVNPKFTELTGYTLKEAFGKNPRILKSGEQSSDFYKELWDTISSGKEWHGEFHNKKKDGELFWESAIIAPIIDSNNKITHYVALKEDVTEKKRLLLELISAKDRAEHADKLKTSFLQNMSHEIRTPLNGILGFAHLLNRENITTENIRQYAHVIQTSGNRLLELINNLIDISKIESGTLEVTMKEFELNNLIYSVSDQFKPLSASKGVMLKVALEPRSKEINIISDELKIHQILTNLINNAFKFTKEGSVEVGYSLVVDKISFYVKDTGPGISEENQTKIFERFFQIDSSMTRGYEGSGLGLSICKGLVEMLKGEIWVESVLNQGTIFHFTIPLIEGKPLVISEASPEVKPVFKYKSILIAEDDEYSFLYLQEIFNNFNVLITRATNGQDAVDTCKSRKDIDLVMMDIKQKWRIASASSLTASTRNKRWK
ncbi:MAG: PAS domain S-box protein [Bacteroidales bacterium]|nr:PAS domain S-box protein [Bacteroidales bacterium]